MITHATPNTRRNHGVIRRASVVCLSTYSLRLASERGTCNREVMRRQYSSVLLAVMKPIGLENAIRKTPRPMNAIESMITILITNPTGAHAIARAAHMSGVKPAKAVVDELEKEVEND